MFNLGQNKPATGGSLFNLGGSTNNAQNTSAPQSSGSSLFPSLGQQPATGSSLFGGANNTNTAAQSNTTAGTSNAPATGGGLFGGLNAGNSNQGKPNGLFGRIGETNKPENATTTAPSSGGLFGGALGGTSTAQNSSNATAPSGGLFGSTNQNNSAATGGSLFGGSMQPAAQQQQQQQQQQQNTAQQDGGNAVQQRSQPAYFDQLLERGRKRQVTENGGNTFGELPSLQLGLGDIARKVRNLGQGGPSSAQKARGGDTKAHYLLAASGVNTGAALRDLTSFSADVTAKTPTAPAAAPLDTDLDAYVEGLYRQSSLNLVEQGLEQAKRDFDDFLEQHVQMEWDAQRRRIYEHFGLVKKGEDLGASIDGGATAKGAFGRSSRRSRLGASTAGFGASGMTKSVLGTPSMRGSRPALFTDVAEKANTTKLMQPAPEDRMLRDKQDQYSERVKSLNISRLEESAYPILYQFAEVESQPSSDDTSHFINAYKALVEIIGEKPSSTKASEPGVVKERQFAKDYLDDAPTSRNAFALRKRIIDGSRTFLEKQFVGSLETAVAKNPKEANLGGVPTAINKVRAYIRLRSLRKELGADNVELQSLGDDYCWVLIFYLLRAGLVQEAAQYVSENERAIKSMDRNFPIYLSSYARSEDRRLSPDLQGRISSEYSQRTRISPENSLDPYRMACYKVIGRCELSRRSLDNINPSMEDWVWLQFALAREVNRVQETASEVFALEDVRNVFNEIGQRHFGQGSEGASAYGTYFFLQILAGQFESAVAWLYPHNYLTAVHFAVSLNYYGLLRVNDFNGSDDLLSYTTRQQPQISFGHMLGYYTRDFRASNPAAAADYLALICLNSDVEGEQGKRQTQLCHEALRELVLETREFAQLLGDIRNDGQRIKGAIEQRLKLIRIDNEQTFLRQITIGAAQIADENGRITDAVLLYHLAEEYDDVISVCCRAVSDATSTEPGDAPVRLEPLKPRQPANQSGAPVPAHQQEGSLSLTAVDDPAALARNMISLYRSNTLMYQKVKPNNRGLIELLLGIAEAKTTIEAGRWALALDQISALNLLPINANGRVSAIRDRAQTFNTLPHLVSRNIGNLLIWTISAAGRQRELLRESEFEPERQRVADHCLQVAKDTMVFAGLVRYKLPPRVFEVLARVGGDVGAY